MNELVTVIIPYYNNESTIIRAIDSVVNQTYKNIEVILINDGSTDNSFSIVSEYIEKFKDLNIININQQNQGPSSARNRGIKIANGKYIAFLDGDDTWKFEKLYKQMFILDKKSEIDMLGCNFYIIIKDEKKKKHFVKEDFTKITFRKMLYKHYYAPPCVIVKKDVLIKCGMFDTEQNYMEDSLLFTKITREFNCYMTNDFLVNTYKNSFGESGLSGNLNKMQKYELINYKKLYKDNDLSSTKLFVWEFVFCYVFSIVKFFRRKLIVALRS